MPICKNCNESFPNRAWIDNKQRALNKRSYCLKCSPWGEKNGFVLRKQETIKNHNDKKCLICERNFPWNKNNICSTCRVLYAKYCQKKKAISHLGGKCVKCGEEDFWQLTFHHLNPDEKSYTMAAIWGLVNYEIILKEIDKCVLLCLKCHRIEHSGKDKLSKIIEYYEKENDTR